MHFCDTDATMLLYISAGLPVSGTDFLYTAARVWRMALPDTRRLTE